MPIQPIHVLSDVVSLEQLCEEVAKLQRTLKYLLEGNLDSENTREIGGWRISKDEMVSKDGDVGMSTEDTAGDDIRFWAGGTNKETAPWRVPKSGKMHATGAVIESASGYPKVVLDPDGNLLAAYSSPDTYIAFTPQGPNDVPAIALYANGSIVGYLNRFVDTTTLTTFNGEHINLQPSGQLKIGGTSAVSGTVYVSPTNGGAATIPITFTKGIRTQ